MLCPLQLKCHRKGEVLHSDGKKVLAKMVSNIFHFTADYTSCRKDKWDDKWNSLCPSARLFRGQCICSLNSKCDISSMNPWSQHAFCHQIRLVGVLLGCGECVVGTHRPLNTNPASCECHSLESSRVMLLIMCIHL